MSVAPSCSVKEMKTEIPNKKAGFWRCNAVRLQLSILLCAANFVVVCARSGLGMAMVCMVNSTAVGTLHGHSINSSHRNQSTSSDDDCSISNPVQHDYEGEYVWSSNEQGTLFAAIYWGSLLSVPGGFLVDRYGPKSILIIMGILNVVCSFLTPPSVNLAGFGGLFGVRFLMGLSIGLLVPGTNAFIARWIPEKERSSVVCLVSAGSQLAMIAVTPLNAFMCQIEGTFGGWPLIFYVTGSITMLWLLIWLCYANDHPLKHRRMGSTERRLFADTDLGQSSRTGLRLVPWRALCSSPAVWACVVCNFSFGCLTTIATTYLPTYFMEVLHLSLRSNGWFSAAPLVAQVFGKAFFTWVSGLDCLRKRLRPTNVSKLLNTIGLVGAAVLLVACSFVHCDEAVLAVFLLCFSLGIYGGAVPGFMTSQVAVAPRYAGTVSTIAMVTNNVGGVVSPFAVGLITVHGNNSEWRIVFGLLAGCLVLSAIVFLVYGSNETEKWAMMKKECKVATMTTKFSVTTIGSELDTTTRERL